MSDAAASWQIDGDAARLKCGPLEGSVEPATNGEWFRAMQWQGAPVEGCFALLATAGENYDRQLLERHVRGCDLVDVFPKSAQGISPEAYWRATSQPEQGAVQLELIYSKHTDLLDSNPQSTIVTQVTGTRVFRCSNLKSGQFSELHLAPDPGVLFQAEASRESLVLFRDKARNLTYAEMVHPTDFVSTQLLTNDQRERIATSVLFAERLEKGVIRRGRICGWFLPAHNDLPNALTLARQFVDQPLPLTT